DARRRVGVVDEHRHRGVGGDDLESARHPPEVPEAGGDRLEGDGEGQGTAGGDEGVVDVEVAAEGQGDVHFPFGGDEDEPGTFHPDAPLAGGDVGVGADRQIRDAGHGGEAPAGRVVDPDHRSLGQVGLEEPGRGEEVALHVAVEVEVVLGQVGEGGDGETRRVDPVHGEG